MTVPRIGYVHSWSRTQDEGWVRAALDYYGVPYTYFADKLLKQGNLRSKYDVIIFPHVGGTPQSMINGVAMTGNAPMPYKKTEQTPNLGGIDETDDIRGGMGFEGLQELAKFVQAGRRADHRGIHLDPDGGIQPGRRRYRGAPGESVRARLDPARRLQRPEEPDRVRVRRQGPAGVLQPGSGAERLAARRRSGRLRGRTRGRGGPTDGGRT